VCGTSANRDGAPAVLNVNRSSTSVGITFNELGRGADVKVFGSVLAENVLGMIVHEHYCPKYDEENAYDRAIWEGSYFLAPNEKINQTRGLMT